MGPLVEDLLAQRRHPQRVVAIDGPGKLDELRQPIATVQGNDLHAASRLVLYALLAIALAVAAVHIDCLLAQR